MKKGTLALALPLALTLSWPNAYGNPYDESYLAQYPVPDEFRVPNVRDARWKAIDVRPGFAVFVDADSVFISSDRAYFSRSVRILSTAGKAPFSDHLPPGTPYGSEASGRTEVDCAMGKTRMHDMAFGDYYLGARGKPLDGSGAFSKAHPLEISIFCLSDRSQSLRKLDELDKVNRPNVGAELYGRYDQ